MMTVIGIILIVAAVFLVVAVLMQHGKSHNLSGTIAGASETFFGKSKGSTVDRKLQIITTVVAIVFVVLVLVAYLIQDSAFVTGGDDTTAADSAVTTVADSSSDTTADTADTTVADSADPAESSDVVSDTEAADPAESTTAA